MITQDIVLKVETESPANEIITKAASAIKEGGIIAFPTRCLYGLGTDAFNAEAVERIFKIKQRAAQNPILILTFKNIFPWINSFIFRLNTKMR